MTLKQYRKVLARLALSASLLISVGSAKAIAQNQLTGQSTGLTSQELLGGGQGLVRVPNQASLFPHIPHTLVPKAVRPPSVDYYQPPQQVNGLAEQAIAPPSTETSSRIGTEMSPERAASPIPAATTPPVRNLLTQLTDDQIREQLFIEPNDVPDAVSKRARPVPASSFLTPTAYGADWGDAYIGLAQVTEGNRSTFDGSAAIGIGFGDAVKNVGLEVSTSIISLNGIAEDGIIGFKLHKVFPKAGNLAVALGWSNPIKWGDATERENNFYGVATKQFDLRPNQTNRLPLTASLGLGATDPYLTSGEGENSLGVFGSLGLRVIPEVSLITSWTGTYLSVAASAAPFNAPFVFSVGASDITGRSAEGTRFNSTVGYSFSF